MFFAMAGETITTWWQQLEKCGITRAPEACKQHDDALILPQYEALAVSCC